MKPWRPEMYFSDVPNKGGPCKNLQNNKLSYFSFIIIAVYKTNFHPEWSTFGSFILKGVNMSNEHDYLNSCAIRKNSKIQRWL
jgi:hypothetical protein